jgi:hypothetical protein
MMMMMQMTVMLVDNVHDENIERWKRKIPNFNNVKNINWISCGRTTGHWFFFLLLAGE